MSLSRRLFLGQSAAALPAAAAAAVAVPAAADASVSSPVDTAHTSLAHPSVESLRQASAPPPVRPKGDEVKAMVSNRLLAKADRLFNGQLAGRMAELLQNSRRAGATEIRITCVAMQSPSEEEKKNGVKLRYAITLEDNGSGIDDFGNLLSLGHSDWSEKIEDAEDPAGAGFFSLAPRTVTVSSRGRQVKITPNGWVGIAVPVVDCDYQKPGVRLEFVDDEAWTEQEVRRQAAFSGVACYLNGSCVPSVTFISEHAPVLHWPKLGVKIQLGPEHSSTSRDSLLNNMGKSWMQVHVNFHGQIVSTSTDVPSVIKALGLRVYVELTGESTLLRMKLPDRSDVVHNDAYKELMTAIQLYAFQSLSPSVRHHLPFSEYQTAQRLGVEIAEAVPSYATGAAKWPNDSEPTESCRNARDEVQPLRLGVTSREDGGRLLDILEQEVDAELWPYYGVRVADIYNGYAWEKANARVTDLSYEVEPAHPIERANVNDGSIEVYDSITAVIEVSDREEPFRIAVPYAPDGSDTAMVTKDALMRQGNMQLIFQLTGGYNPDDGYSEDKYWEDFQEAVDELCSDLKGPHEHVRATLAKATEDFFDGLRRQLPKAEGEEAPAKTAWKAVRVLPTGRIEVTLNNGKRHTINPVE